MNGWGLQAAPLSPLPTSQSWGYIKIGIKRGGGGVPETNSLVTLVHMKLEPIYSLKNNTNRLWL